MEQKGILCYGYDAMNLQDMVRKIGGVLGCEIIGIDATGHEHDAVRDILEGCPPRESSPIGTRFVMFLGFDDCEIRDAMASISIEPRPIFCCLTQQNYVWELSHLAKHLEAEREAIRRGDRN